MVFLMVIRDEPPPMQAFFIVIGCVMAYIITIAAMQAAIKKDHWPGKDSGYAWLWPIAICWMVGVKVGGTVRRGLDSRRLPKAKVANKKRGR